MISLSEAKAQLNETGTEHDTEIQAYIDGVTAVVERRTGEVVEPRQITEHHVLSGVVTLMLRSVPARSLAEVETVDGSQTWDTTDLHLDQRSGRLLVVDGPALSGHVLITVEAGYQTIPPNYTLAARIILAHLWRTQRGVGAPSAFAGAAASGEGGAGFAVPYRARELLGGPLPGVA